MKTIFYKILYKNRDVVYVGVTTCTIKKRFKEHLISKSLNTRDYSVVEFDYIEHPEINSIDVFYEERKKVAKLEQKYIREELDRGSNLMNLSKGGEWGSHILDKLRQEEFIKEFGSYENYKSFKKKKLKVRVCLRNWVQHKSDSKVKCLLYNWVLVRSTNRTKALLRNWIIHRSINKVKILLGHWVTSRSDNKAKVLLRNWVAYRSTNKVKKLLKNWIQVRSKNKTLDK